VKAPLSGAVGHIMLLTGSIARACAALALLAACAAGPVAAEASTPALIWRDVARINVLCLVQTEAGVDRGALHDLVCDSVREAAAAGSPAPVALIEAGDPALLATDSLALLVHASVQGDADHRLLVFTIRPFRNNGEPLLFTAAPRAVQIADPARPAPELEAALRAALSETLPWLNRPAGARPIH
jgi:hypothetical protein